MTVRKIVYFYRWLMGRRRKLKRDSKTDGNEDRVHLRGKGGR